jgi:TrmH family RNA methyltransferase
VWAAGLGGHDARTWRPIRPVLLMLGSEGGGLAPETFDLADGVVSIPLDRDVESLNVAVAAGILLWHATGGGGEARGNDL